ncbi:hypothetical protein OS493_022325 [Desmophyllum pertusum]|uniref:Transmembrane protein n=1 Tax=Desmophyllum pertusum TaxID=174260 RepID=A0A9W9ZZS8_9CNID|nr:hypothetical protein OS493_022325 [Desmophyllum pertusum]
MIAAHFSDPSLPLDALETPLGFIMMEGNRKNFTENIVQFGFLRSVKLLSRRIMAINHHLHHQQHHSSADRACDFHAHAHLSLAIVFTALWLLYALPIYLQFLTLSLLTLYLAKVVLKTRRTSLDPITFRNYVLGSFSTVNIIFFAINITSSFVCPEQDAHEKLVILRVVVNGLLFVVVGIVLCFCIIKITRAPAVNVLLEGQGATTRQGIVLCVLVVLLYLSRVVYNLIAVTVPHDLSSFGYGWINVSDEGEIKYKDSPRESIHEDIRDVEFITFGVVLIGPSAIASQSYDQKSYFFDNPRRYDSDEDLTNSQGQPRGNYNIPGVLSPSTSSVNVSSRARSYGSISGMRSGSFQKSNSYSNAYIPGTTPPQLFSAGRPGYQPSVLVEQNEGQ